MAINGSFSAVILAAGFSERMGTPKLTMAFKGRTFVENITSGFYKSGIHEIVIVVNPDTVHVCQALFPEENSCTRIVINKHPERGRFSSLKTGLSALKNKYMCFIHNVDNPFAEETVITGMMKSAIPDTFSVPVYGQKKGHPVLISERIISDIITTPQDDINLKQFLKSYHCLHYVSSTDSILVNINNMNDYMTALKNYEKK